MHIVYSICSMIIVEIVFSLYFDEINEFQKTKIVFCSVFPSGLDETIVRLKRSFGVILAIFGHFCKIEKSAHRRHLVDGYRQCLNSTINVQKISPMAPDAEKLFNDPTDHWQNGSARKTREICDVTTQISKLKKLNRFFNLVFLKINIF